MRNILIVIVLSLLGYSSCKNIPYSDFCETKQLLKTVEKDISKLKQDVKEDAIEKFIKTLQAEGKPVTEVEIDQFYGLKKPEEIFKNNGKRGLDKDITKWPKNNQGLLKIPYLIRVPAEWHPYLAWYYINTIQSATAALNRVLSSCNANVFVERTNELDYIEIIPGKGSQAGCWSPVGKQGGKQQLGLSWGCNFIQGIIHHELMHAMGFQHEQSRTDRDDFVVVDFSKITPGMEHNYYKRNTHTDTSYDFGSVMHYDSKAFGKDGAIVMKKKENIQKSVVDGEMGNRRVMSETDKTKLLKAYHCFGSRGDSSEYHNGKDIHSQMKKDDTLKKMQDTKVALENVIKDIGILKD